MTEGSVLAALGKSLGPWLGGAVLIGLALQRILKGWEPFAKMKFDRDNAIIDKLNQRVDSLERQLGEAEARADQLRDRLEDKIEAQRKDYERRSEQDRVYHEYDLREARHRANGAFQSLKLLVALLEADEDTLSPRAQKALSLVRRSLEEEDQRAAEERVSIQRAKTAMVDQPAPIAA